ncbi:capsule biosynthesis protein [Glaciimonas soli]|uniref:Capsular biosynthesis protein n=1 Tax=Glaciimonas soli TaxID=2590999 RepID=A0A843YLN8_9BURK|nr:capsular biosynthesis protein [Glaciimonas soli]MQR00789.1 capsular biosynthesis protein [Glaciimonas soli]
MIKSGLSEFKSKRVLLLQGPLGPFFKKLGRDLTRAGAQVSKVNFNGGDWLFSSSGSILFRGRVEEWPAFFERVLSEHKIDVVLLFGDCRAMHGIAHEIAAGRGIEIGVFEEGYVRPDYITLERFGVNGYSQIPRDPAVYLNKPIVDIPQNIAVGNAFWHATWWAMSYYLASALLRPVFRHYEHHRPLSLWEGIPWLRSIWRKQYFARKEKGSQAELSSTLTKQFYLVVLQVHNDAQMHVHSDFESIAAFIDCTLTSFAQFAPPGTHLVIKHHPMDRGYHDHTRLIAELARRHGIQDSVRYIHDQHLPTLLEHARGVVLVNSTVGLSALHHSTPLMVCGEAIYDIPGLTFQGSLDQFWRQAEEQPVNGELYQRFRNYLIEHTQLNGNFYRQLDIAGSYAGLQWSASVDEPEVIDAVDEKSCQPTSSQAPLCP